MSAVLAQAVTLAQGGEVSTGEAVAFWILGPAAVAGALGMILARNAVHSALWLVLTMLSLAMIYLTQRATFLGFTQIIVYTGAIMMLFLFVLMLAGRDSSDSVVEVLRGQRLAAGLLGIGLAVLVVTLLGRSLTDTQIAAPLDPYSPEGGGAGGLGRLIFGDFLFPFELSAALLIVAAVGAMLLSHSGGKKTKKTQRELVEERFRGQHDRPSPLPGPGVFATANSVATPALLPDGSVAPESLSRIIDSAAAEEFRDEIREVSGTGPEADAHALITPAEGAEAPGGEGTDGQRADSEGDKA
ncbi:NADH dehydrogenase subunit J [Tamaricihabitans halophyticus]|uniref:NADH-quinone oxidoreductase subunit J n=1 Tax=Tamaricihabitans halophyticus TaxID=1262583 RepID=A0A4R2QTV8_9PSEU|nr:NADH-quinone oxidoreductase subunit J [Tamaricihabitans halophyticus]TCP53147.1 NADH dehydrogenase subunit J [Tamaricihabitans halophyticus]